MHAHMAGNVNATWRAPQGYLRFPYRVPVGPYDQLWDWDSLLLGVAGLRCAPLRAPTHPGPRRRGTPAQVRVRRVLRGQHPFEGSILDHTNTTTGEVPGTATGRFAVPCKGNT